MNVDPKCDYSFMVSCCETKPLNSAAFQLFSFTFHKELDSSTGSAQVRIIFLLRMQIVSSKVRPQCMREMSLSAAYRLPLSRWMPAVLEGESLEDA